MSEKIDQDLVDKIQKLLNLANDESTTDGERDNANLAVARLLAKYRLTKAEVEIASRSHTDMSQDPIPLATWSRKVVWRESLMITLANHYGCFLFNRSTGQGREREMIITGRANDIAIVRHMYARLTFQILSTIGRIGKGKGAIHNASWCEGAVVGITNQLNKAADEIKKEVSISHDANKSNALVLLNNRTNLARDYAEQLLREMLGNNGKFTSKKTISSRQRDHDAFSSGVEAGKKMDVHGHKQLGGGKILLKLDERRRYDS